jgi:hypothetical protein
VRTEGAHLTPQDVGVSTFTDRVRAPCAQAVDVRVVRLCAGTCGPQMVPNTARHRAATRIIVHSSAAAQEEAGIHDHACWGRVHLQVNQHIQTQVEDHLPQRHATLGDEEPLMSAAGRIEKPPDEVVRR